MSRCTLWPPIPDDKMGVVLAHHASAQTRTSAQVID